ncbi:MAG: 3-mercaptopyruvate sulfurtransferase [Pseudomonadota bacterium]
MIQTVETNFISQEETINLIGRDDVSFVDSSWYLPAQKRDGYAEYRSMRIPGAVFFDINQIVDPDTDLPHMLPSPEQFARAVSLLGISHENRIIVYDGPGLFCAPRAWWTFSIMGAQDVRILEGGFDQWKAKDLPMETGNPNPPRAKLFKTNFNSDRVASKLDVQAAIKNAEAKILDARSINRFLGTEPEPREGLRSGHMPGAKSLPFTELITNEGKMIDRSELETLFQSMNIDQDTPIITSCGSGVTAAVISLALTQAGFHNHRLYDGSWAEWGQPNGPEIATNGEK